jgi:glycosyltransferase involved in cell wall biosynthesis
MVQRHIPSAQLVIAGDPGAQAPAAMPGARMLGRVDKPTLADLYSAAGCLVVSSRYEGFGLPCLEAMACGCPVVAYRNSSLPEVVDDAGLLVDDGDAAALGAAAATVLGDPEPWRQSALTWARRFSWDKTARETVTAYEAVLARLR